jgi:hypothetical protein
MFIIFSIHNGLQMDHRTHCVLNTHILALMMYVFLIEVLLSFIISLIRCVLHGHPISFLLIL